MGDSFFLRGALWLEARLGVRSLRLLVMMLASYWLAPSGMTITSL